MYFNEENLRNNQEPHSIGSYVRDSKVGRNDTCPCGSGKKFKRCCIHQEQHQPKGYIPMNEIGKKHLKILTDRNKLEQYLLQSNNHKDFYENIFYPLWNALGNQFIKNFQSIWSFVSSIRTNQFENYDDTVIQLMRCMTVEELNEMDSKGSIQSPSWTSDPNYVTNFKNFPILTRSTNHVVIVLGLFQTKDIVHAHDIESEYFMRKGATPLYKTTLLDWYPEDVEKTYGTSIENLYITHEECGNSFNNFLSVFEKRGIQLNGFKDSNGVYSTTDPTGKISEFHSNYNDEVYAIETLVGSVIDFSISSSQKMKTN